MTSVLQCKIEFFIHSIIITILIYQEDTLNNIKISYHADDDHHFIITEAPTEEEEEEDKE